MAYRRKSSRRSTRKTTRRSTGRKTDPRRASSKRRTAKRKTRAAKPQRIVLVVQQAPAISPTLATPAAKAKPVRARFGG